MKISLHPSRNPLVRMYQFFDLEGVEPRDDARFLGVDELGLERLGGEDARKLIQFLWQSAGDSLTMCRLKVGAQTVIDFAKPSVFDWPDQESIADLASSNQLSVECRDILLDWQQQVEQYRLYGSAQPISEFKTDCLQVLDELSACDAGEQAIALEIRLRKAKLIEQLLLAPFPDLSGKVSVLVWRDAEFMIKSLRDFRTFLARVADEAACPILLLFYEPTEAFHGDYFKIASLGGPPETLDEREQELADSLGAFTPEILGEYAELRRRHVREERTGEGERLNLPPALLLRQSASETLYPEHTLFEKGPLRSLLVYALMAWLAHCTEAQGEETCFELRFPGQVCLKFAFDDVTEETGSIFAPGVQWKDILGPLIHDVQRSAGRTTLKKLWGKELEKLERDDFVASMFLPTLERVHESFVELESKLPQLAGDPPDLQLKIILNTVNRAFGFELESPSGQISIPSHKAKGTIQLRTGDLGEGYEDLSRLAQAELTRKLNLKPVPGAAQPMPGVDHLKIEGRRLWKKLIPASYKREYRRLRGQGGGDITLLIVSNEPTFPWEMVMPIGSDAAGQEYLWWAVEFSLARWLTGDEVPPPASQIGFKRVCCAVDSSTLSSAEEEVEYFQKIGVDLDIPQDKEELLTFLSTRDYDVLHFACHGEFDTDSPGRSAIQLKKDVLIPDDLYLHYDGIEKKMKENRTLVFLNACHSGRVGPSITHLEGWAVSFIEMHCGAFIGCGWEVSDPLAATFATGFYEHFRSGRTLGRAAYLARADIRKTNLDNSTWLAYYLYGDPNCLREDLP